MPIPYYHVDSFTGSLFAGNPAGVCILPAFPDDETMRSIAAENRHSETAFVVARSDESFALRWFTPQLEDDLCGHATLATAFVLGLRGHNSWPIRFHTRAGVLTVDRIKQPDQLGDLFEMDFPARPPVPGEPWPELLAALGLDRAEILRSVRDILVVLDSAEGVQNLKPDFAALLDLNMGNAGAIVTAPGGAIPETARDADYVCRLFAPSAGINEDPATGSIHCTLAPYWAQRTGKQTFRVRQLSSRGGQLQSSIAADRVKIAGAARLYLEGTIHLP
jgi:PhzF family phenazine biosynthesis protein